MNRRTSSCATLATAVLLACGGGPEPVGPGPINSTCTKPALTLGATVTGNTGTNVCKDSKGSFNYFTFTVTQTTAVSVALTGNAFPGFLGLDYDSGQPVMQRNPNTGAVTIPVVLGPGTYSVRVGSVSGTDGGYTLSVSPLNLEACVAELFVSEGAVFSGRLTSTNCRDNVGNFFLSLTLSTRAAKLSTVTVTLDKKAAVLSQVAGPGTVTGVVPTSPLVAYFIGSFALTALPALASVPIAYTISVP